MERKVVLITGASRGIGAECAKTFAKAGYDVVVNYNKSEIEALKVKNECEKLGAAVLLIKADMGNSEEIKNMVKTTISAFGKIDVLINNAGISLSKLLIDTTDLDVYEVINTNLTSIILTSREVVRNMISQEVSGKIINISSMWGVNGASMETVYSASKAGIIGFTQGLAKEVGMMNINVNAIAPGVIMTDMMKGYTDADIEDLRKCTSLERLGKPEDIAKVALFLASKDASYITGQCISVDGGFV